MESIDYIASPTAGEFHRDDNFVRGLIGPIGSGKSVSCCIEIFKRACEQRAHTDGVRYSRWVIVRNTYRELVDTTMQTWFDWFPKTLGHWRAADMKQTIEFTLTDETVVHLEVLFRALDRPDDVKKLLSLELTGGWINEAREIPKPILDMLIGRVGRYPSKRYGGASWYGVINDTNPPDTDHWWYRMFEEQQPEGWKDFHQPSGVSPEAENIDNLPDEYYKRLSSGKDQEWINVYVHGKYGFVQDGKIIYPEYNDNLHCVHDLGLHEKTEKVIIGVDFGLTPAAVIAQISRSDGQVQILDEIVTEDMGAVRFGKRIKELILSNYDNLPMEGYGDPAGEQRSQVDERTPFFVLEAQGVFLRPGPTNDFTIRRESVAKLLTTLTLLGRPQLVISPKCRMLRKAMAGGYKYRRINVSGTDKYAEKPDKNMYSHVAEALQYLCTGLGHGYELLKRAEDEVPRDYSAQGLDYDPLGRAAA